jgi:hypothetical protein
VVDMPDVLFFLLLAHIFGDYALQTDYMAKMKGSSKKVLSIHVLIYTVTIGAFWWLGKFLTKSPNFPAPVDLVVLAALYVQHWLQDYVKTTKSNGGKQWMFVDQALHISALYIIRMFF